MKDHAHRACEESHIEGVGTFGFLEDEPAVLDFADGLPAGSPETIFDGEFVGKNQFHVCVICMDL